MGTTAGACRARTADARGEPQHGLLATSKRDLTGPAGERYLDVRRRLRPRWALVWIQLFTGHAVLAALFVAFALWGPGWTWWAVPAAIAGGAAIGFTLHYLVLFQHEAAHYNLAPSQRANDLLCDLAISIFIGESIASYRPVHLAHHRHLGTPDDSERSYFEAPNLRFTVEGLTGIRLLRTLTHRSRVRASTGGTTAATRQLPVLPAAAALVTATIVGLALDFGRPALAAAWVLGLAVLLPFLISLRQVLEHRSDTARPDVDYATVAQGATNRLFGTGPLASTFGAAGFNRHLLHHWDPGVSYTRLAEIEAFLLHTPSGDDVRDAHTTYFATLRRLVCP